MRTALAYAIAHRGKRNYIYLVLILHHNNVAFAEAGRGCCEFWLAIAISKGIKINIAHNSSLLDTNVKQDQKLYGYHRLR